MQTALAVSNQTIRPRGRPTVWTEAKTAEVLAALGNGLTRTGTAALCEISYDAFVNRIRADEDFALAVLAAEAKWEQKCLNCINEAMPDSWQAAAWGLERRKPHEYGRQERLMVLRALTSEVAGLPDEELRALAYGASEGDGEVIDVEARVDEEE